MTNEEMVKVLQQSMQQSIQQSLEPVNQRLDAIESGLEPVNQRLDMLQKDVDEMKKEMGERMTRLEVSYENNTKEILNLLREDYGRVAAATAKTGDYDEVKSMVKDHDNALVNHNQRITSLEKQAI